MKPGPKKGVKFTPEHCANISKSRIGTIPWNKGKTGVYSEETLAKMGVAHLGNSYRKGAKHSKETLAKFKLRPVVFGRKHSEETKEKIRRAITGIKRSDETKKKIGLTSKGRFAGIKSPMYGKSLPSEKCGGWKGGRIISLGYALIKDRSHPFCNGHGYIQEHRLMMEKKIGRFLSPKEVVHHINGITSDNRIENLMLFENQSKHIEFHGKST